jgi:hypothetical protein
MEIIAAILSLLGILLLIVIINLICNKILNAGVKASLNVTYKGSMELADKLSSQMWCFQANIPKDVFIERVKANFPEKLSYLALKVKWLCRRDGDTLEFVIGPYKHLPDYSSVKHAAGKMVFSDNAEGGVSAIFVFTSISTTYGICPFAKFMEELVNGFDETVKDADMSVTMAVLPRPGSNRDLSSVH